ncbi:MAG: hypothetical protein ABSH50_17855 [Bryobacteraceae bacterium]
MSNSFRVSSLAVLLATLSIAGYGQSGYTYTVFDFPGAGVQGTAGTGINDAGEVVGYYYDSYVYMHGFLWANGSMNTVDFPLSEMQTSLYGINNCGTIVGHIFYNNGTTISRSFVLADGKYTLVNYPGSVFTLAGGINNYGIVAGSYELGDAPNYYNFLWSGGQFDTISMPGKHNPVVMGINDLGDLAGLYFDGPFPDQTNVGFVYIRKSNTFLTLSYPGGVNTTATGINNLEQVVGYYYASPKSIAQAFVYANGVYTPVGPFANGAEAWGINNLGVIVGTLWQPDGGSLGFLATPASATRLDRPNSSSCSP